MKVKNKYIKEYKSGGGVKQYPDWAKKILDYETESGSGGGAGLKNYGIQREKWGKKYEYLDKETISEEDALQFITEEYLPLVKDYPEDVQKRLVDYAYNTGRNIEDVLLHASGLTDLESVQTKNTDFDTFNKNRDAIIKNMSDPAFILNIDKSKHEILKDTWKRKGTPEVYEKTSKARIDMWNESTDLGTVPVGKKTGVVASSSVPAANEPIKEVGVSSPVAVDSKKVLRNYIDKVKQGSPGMSWRDKDISILLSPGIAAQDWRVESLTDTGKGVKYGEPDKSASSPIKPVTVPSPAEVKPNTVSSTEVSKNTDKTSGYKLVRGGTEAVAKYQEMLKSEGLYDGNIDGAWGPKTKEGYEKFRKRTMNLDINKKAPAMKKGGYVRHMMSGGIAGDPPKGRRFQSLKDKNVIIVEGQDGKTYSSMDGGKTYKEAPPQIKDAFSKEFSEQKNQKAINWQRMGGEGIENDPTAQMSKIEPLPAIGKRPFSVVSTGRKYIDNRFQSNPVNDEDAPLNTDNVAFTPDPTDWGAEMDRGDIPFAPKIPGINEFGKKTADELGMKIDVPGNNPSSTGADDSGMSDVEKRIQDEIEKRKKDVTENAANTIEDYENLTDRTNSRNLQGLAVSMVGRLLQDRRQDVALKSSNHIKQRYRGYSAQQIAQESQGVAGSGVEAVKQMGRNPSDITARIAPILLARMGASEGSARKSYNDYNMNLERAKYGELNEIINTNEKIRADQKNTERDMGNRTIAGISSDVGKFIQSINQTDGKMVDIKSKVNQQKINDLYSLGNSSIEMDLAKMDYSQQKDYLDKRINDIRTELDSNKINLDEEDIKKLEENLAEYERMRDKANIKNSLRK